MTTISRDALRDALKDLPRRELEDLRDEIDRELVKCAACGNEGARPLAVRFRPGGARATIDASIPFCLPCVEKHRLPASRAEATGL
jgi:hypothetical protein